MTPTVCTCGHDTLGHLNGKVCMAGDCNCVLFDAGAATGQGRAEQASRRLLGDVEYEAQKAHANSLRELQLQQAVFVTGRLAADAEVRDALAALLTLAWWLLPPTVVALVAAICLAVAR